MSSAADYYGGSAIPQTKDYGPPALDFSNFTNAISKFYEGRKEGREEDQARAFRNGIPTDDGTPKGNPDYGAMSRKMLELGNYPEAASLQQTGIQMQQLRNAGNLGGLIGPGSAAAAPGGAPGAAPAPGGAPGGAGPAPEPTAATEVGPGPAGPPQGPQPRPGPQASIQPPATSLMGALPETMDANTQGAIIGWAHSLGIDPNTPLTPQQSAAVKNKIASLTPNQANRGNDASGPASASAAGIPPPTPQAPAPGAAPDFNQRFAASQRTGVPSNVPATVAPPPGTVSAPIAPQAAAALESRLDAMQPADRKAFLNQLATSPQFPKSINEWAEKRTEALEKASEPTPEQKNFATDRQPGETMAGYQARVAATTEESKADVASYTKAIDANEKAGREAQIEAPKVDLMKQFMNRPDFYSGPLQPTDQLFKQFQATFGGDPNKAMDAEGFKKIAADMLTSQIKQLGASGAGPVRIAEVKNMQKSIANLGVTPASNRLLVEIYDRTYKDVQAVAALSRQYDATTKNAPGHKNAGLNEAVANYYTTHPMFSKAEMADPRLIAPPEFKDVTAAAAAKLPKGQPVMINGKLQYVQK
jgi:hypothetical protein